MAFFFIIMIKLLPPLSPKKRGLASTTQFALSHEAESEYEIRRRAEVRPRDGSSRL